MINDVQPYGSETVTIVEASADTMVVYTGSLKCLRLKSCRIYFVQFDAYDFKKVFWPQHLLYHIADYTILSHKRELTGKKILLKKV